MKFLLLILFIAAVVAAWRLRVPIIAKLTGQDEARIRRQIGRKK